VSRARASEAPWLEPIRAVLRTRIAVLVETGAAESAAACRWSLGVVEGEASRWWLAEFTRTEAATERGWSEDTIDRKLKKGELANVGTKGHPRFQRCELWSVAKGDVGESVWNRHRRAQERNS
jgi:hypothetical protein